MSSSSRRDPSVDRHISAMVRRLGCVFRMAILGRWYIADTIGLVFCATDGSWPLANFYSGVDYKMGYIRLSVTILTISNRVTNRVYGIAAVFALLMVPASVTSTERDDQLQARYTLCMDKTDASFLEEFRGSCDVLCIHQQPASENDCLARHMTWDTANCTLPTAEEEREGRHLEEAKERCLKEFKAGITTPP
jgi:hypothetical protein